MPCVNHPEVQDGLNRCGRCRQPFCADCLVEIKGQSLCADCKVEQVQDLKSGVDTSGGPLQLAGIGRRFVAMFIDGLIFSPVTVGGMFLFGLFNPQQAGAHPEQMGALNPSLILFMLVVLGLNFAYEGFMLQIRGQTLGKMAMGIKVVRPDGGDISGGQAWIRPAVRSGINFIPLVGGCAGLVNYFWAVFTKEKTCLHDLAAKTRVVKLP